jgi:hypothetical protein
MFTVHLDAIRGRHHCYYLFSRKLAGVALDLRTGGAEVQNRHIQGL